MPPNNAGSCCESKRKITWQLGLGIVLLVAPASNGMTGFLAHAGWFQSIKIDYQAWYVDYPAYLMLCWFLMGIGLTLIGCEIARFSGQKTVGQGGGSDGLTTDAEMASSVEATDR